MSITHAVRYGLIVSALSLTAVPAYANDPFSKAVHDATNTVVQAVTPPHVDIQVDFKKPLTPVKVEVKKDGASVTIQPSPVPAPPVVHAPGNGFVANAINKTNEIVQAPKNFIDQKGREINDGFIHLGNEIGMFWAKLKHNIEQTVADWIQWLKDQAQKYGIYALAGFGALFLVRGFFRFVFGRRGHGSRTKYAGYHA